MTTLVVAGVVSFGLASCEPLPPRLDLTVVTTVLGQDDAPGDGVCSSAAAAGQCTLQAAIDEGNTAPAGADLTVPTGTYAAFDPTITGDVAINTGAADRFDFDARVRVEVADSAVLTLTGFEGAVYEEAKIVVDGTLHLRRSDVETLAGTVVNAGGVAVITNSVIRGFTGLVNDGTAIVVDSTISADRVVETGPSGSTVLARSRLVPILRPEDTPAFCVGNPAFVSVGYVHAAMPCSSTPGPGDWMGDPLSDEWEENEDWWEEYAEGLAVDAIPLGAPGCDDPVALDHLGNPRGVDGNGDGIGGCDVGAVERQPTP